jgi:hypothetical protein
VLCGEGRPDERLVEAERGRAVGRTRQLGLELDERQLGAVGRAQPTELEREARPGSGGSPSPGGAAARAATQRAAVEGEDVDGPRNGAPAAELEGQEVAGERGPLDPRRGRLRRTGLHPQRAMARRAALDHSAGERGGRKKLEVDLGGLPRGGRRSFEIDGDPHSPEGTREAWAADTERVERPQVERRGRGFVEQRADRPQLGQVARDRGRLRPHGGEQRALLEAAVEAAR